MKCSRGYFGVRTDLPREELLETLGTAAFEAVVPDRPYKDLQIGKELLLER